MAVLIEVERDGEGEGEREREREIKRERTLELLMQATYLNMHLPGPWQVLKVQCHVSKIISNSCSDYDFTS